MNFPPQRKPNKFTRNHLHGSKYGSRNMDRVNTPFDKTNKLSSDDESIYLSDIVDDYSSSMKSRALVSFASALSGSVITSFFLSFFFSKPSGTLVAVLSSLFGMSCFGSGEFASVSRSLGVMAILLLQRIRQSTFAPKLFQYVTAAFAVRRRHPFPPVENPWTYRRDVPADPPFDMVQSLAGVSIAGGYMGWALAKVIPLVPGWITSLVTILVLCQTATRRSSQGDLVRYIGHSVVSALGEVKDAASEVALWRNLESFLGKLSFQLSSINQQYGVVSTTRVALVNLYEQLLSIINSIRQDMDETEGEQGIHKKSSLSNEFYFDD
eukprot:CAMPEP_0185022476 /NCGR_PEP_ID=MMETSP1103-20130426/5179_1 /TAXON_ID=36769 /ORGANISM="Paraphysomonas bandaiensis, Strain Caron Lab Isolate" /LENGTH=323 /DNA_ID=CAMNT_0027554553 /DNA_START=166 /DNA_END=1137 /DNA_ORIENTATION=-